MQNLKHTSRFLLIFFSSLSFFLFQLFHTHTHTHTHAHTPRIGDGGSLPCARRQPGSLGKGGRRRGGEYATTRFVGKGRERKEEGEDEEEGWGVGGTVLVKRVVFCRFRTSNIRNHTVCRISTASASSTRIRPPNPLRSFLSHYSLNIEPATVPFQPL